MCGIFCSLSQDSYVKPLLSTEQLLKARGPDAANRIEFTRDGNPQLDNRAGEPIYITCYSTVLSLRGSVVIDQPYISSDATNVLCWNGEAWSVQTSHTTGNDTILVHDLLQTVVTKSRHADESTLIGAHKVAEEMSKIAGPYAFVFFDKISGKVYFGRDFLGRRSLLFAVSEDDRNLILSSVADLGLSPNWIEVEADGIYCIDLNQMSSTKPLDSKSVDLWGKYKVIRVPYFSSARPLEGFTSVIPILSLNRETSFPKTSLNCDSHAVKNLEHLLRESLKLRILNIPDPPKPHGYLGVRPISSLAVLFSGGLDCTILARLSHELLSPLEPIDLLNVAFENPRVHKSVDKDVYELCPDRITGRASYIELCQVCPERDWRFIAINVPYSETQEHRQRIISLMYPHNTEMDLSISLALYFAARGTGQSVQNPNYTTSARVLLSGLGADELFAGYARHGLAFKKGGYIGLLDELELDIGRLGKRNLGRDDRIMSHWAREARFPYLDENVVNWALNAPVSDKCGFVQESSWPTASDQSISSCLDPEKKVLRCIALRLGMNNVAKEKKRAIQFGARTAKMETGKTKGTHLLTN